jgi:hypothetical protein
MTIQAHLLFSEPLAALLLVYGLRRIAKPNFLSSLGIAFLPWVHIKYLISMPLLIGSFFNLKKKFKLQLNQKWPFAIVFISILGLIIFNWYAYGSPFSGQEKIGSFFHRFDGFLGTWINRENGILPFSPVFLLSFLGLGALFYKKRQVFWQIISIAGPLWFLTAVFESWHGGQGPPGRMLLPALVVLAPALAEVLILPFKWIFRFIFLILFVPGLFLALRSSFQPHNIIDRNLYSQLNSLSQYLGVNLDIEKWFPLSHHLGFNLNLFWLLFFISLFVLGIVLTKYHKKLEQVDETINHYPGLQ